MGSTLAPGPARFLPTPLTPQLASPRLHLADAPPNPPVASLLSSCDWYGLQNTPCLGTCPACSPGNLRSLDPPSCLELTWAGRPRAASSSHPCQPWTTPLITKGRSSPFWSQELQILPRGSDPRPDKTTRHNTRHSPPRRTVITLDARHLLSRRGSILLRWPTVHSLSSTAQSEGPSTAACPPAQGTELLRPI